MDDGDQGSLPLAERTFKFGYSKETKTFEYDWSKEFFDFVSQKTCEEGEKENLFSDSEIIVQENKPFEIPCLEEFKGTWKISGLPDSVQIGLFNGKICGEFKEIGEFECSVYLRQINSKNKLSIFKQDLIFKVEWQENRKDEIIDNFFQDYSVNHDLRKQEEKEKIGQLSHSLGEYFIKRKRFLSNSC